MTTSPRRIDYAGPEGWTVWTDEDGTHVRTPSGDALESPSVTRLIQLVREAREQAAAGRIPTPRPPSLEELQGTTYRAEVVYARRELIRALNSLDD